MNWTRTAFDLLTLDGHEIYIVEHRVSDREDRQKFFYNAWEGDHRDRSKRTYVAAGDNLETVKAVCEALVKSWEAA